MKKNETVAWLHRGAERAFLKKFCNNLPVCFLSGILIVIILLRNSDFSMVQCLEVGGVSSLTVLLIVFPLAYYCLDIRRAVMRSAKYQGLFLTNTIARYDSYARAFPRLKKHVINEHEYKYADSEGNTMSSSGKKEMKAIEDKLRRLRIKRNEVVAFMEYCEEIIKCPA